MKRIILTQEQQEAIINDYMLNDETIGAIAKNMNLDYQIVKRVINENCIIKQKSKHIDPEIEKLENKIDYQSKCIKLIAYANRLMMDEGNSGLILQTTLDEIFKETPIIDIIKSINNNREFIEFKSYDGHPINKANKTQEEWQKSVNDTNRWICWITNSLYMEDGSLWYDRNGISRIVETTGAIRNNYLTDQRFYFYTIKDSKAQNSQSRMNIINWYNDERGIINELYDTIISLPDGDMKDDTVRKFNIECAKVTKAYFEWARSNADPISTKINIMLPDPSKNNFFEIEI